VSSADALDAYVIVGLETGDGDTSINGVFDRVVVSGVTRGIRMALAEGDDVANLFRAHVRGSVAIGAGWGDDDVNIGGPLTSVTDVNTAIHGRLIVELGEGNDSLRVGGSGIGHGMLAYGGIGNDYFAVARSRIGGILGIAAGAGDDNVIIGQTHAAHVRVGTGSGADQLALIDSTFASIAVNTGEGHDEVVVASVSARAAWFHGGPGNDVLQFQGLSHFGRLRISSFETVRGNGHVNVLANGQTLDDGGVDQPALG
jgi:hypothetical protein